MHSTPPLNSSPKSAEGLSRRLILVGLAFLTATQPAAAAIAADPVFAAIDGHRKAHVAHLVAIDEQARLEKIDDKTDWGITEKPCHDENDAFELLVGTAATTIAGLFAKLNYLREIAESEKAWMLDEREGAALDLIESFTASLANIGVLS